MGGAGGRMRAAASSASSAGEAAPEEAMAHLASGLRLDGRPLPVPRLHRTGWKPSQLFEEADDPDRTQQRWPPPAFVSAEDPAGRRQLCRMEELRLPERLAARGSFARVVRGVLDEAQCLELLERVNEKGFTPALLNIGRGRQLLDPDVRDGHRVVVDSPELSSWLMEALRPYLPSEFRDGYQLIDLNERCRFLCYTPGQSFAAHRDGCYVRPRSHPKAGDRSMVTVQLYLHDVPPENGGATTFLFTGEPDLPCQPGAGSVLLFSQDLLHEGSVVLAGLKYTLRTEAMYRSPPC